MAGSNAGTGRPLHFKCSQCRLVGSRRGYAVDVDLTGRKKTLKTSNAGIRNSKTEREYRCRNCGHVGWSRHMDLERKELKAKEEAENHDPKNWPADPGLAHPRWDDNE